MRCKDSKNLSSANNFCNLFCANVILLLKLSAEWILDCNVLGKIGKYYIYLRRYIINISKQNYMKKILLVLVALLSYAGAMAQVPSVKVENGKGEAVNTALLVDGKTPMIISFWAVTCKPCIRELDEINDQLPDWLEEAKFRVVAISTDDSRFSAQARALVEGHGWSDFTVLYDKNQEFMRAMNVSFTPQVFVVDKSGKIVYSHTGYTPGSEQELIDKIKSLK